MMDHNRHIMLRDGPLQLAAQGLEGGFAPGLFAGVQIDVDVQVGQRSRSVLFAAASGHALVAQLGEDLQSVLGAAVPGRRKKMALERRR